MCGGVCVKTRDRPWREIKPPHHGTRRALPRARAEAAVERRRRRALLLHQDRNARFVMA